MEPTFQDIAPAPPPQDRLQPEPAPAPPKFDKKKLLIISIVAGVLLIGGGVFGYKALNSSSKNETTETETPADATAASDPTTQPEATTETPPAETPTTETPTPPITQPSSPAPTPASPTTHTISYTNSCYSPSSLSIKKGDTIKFVNNTSNKDMWPASDNHPNHTIYPEFDADEDIAPGDSYSFTFTKTGVGASTTT